jgi:transcription elongation GreA/GreB family factor
MSRAFVSEDAAAAAAAVLPERPVSALPNLVTPSGLAGIEAEVTRLEARLAATAAEDAARPALARDLRYWRGRRVSAQLTEPPATPDEVAFGTTVTLRRANGATQRYRIVGEDEADPAAGLLSWASPVAQALMGAVPGEVVETGGGRPAMTVLEIKTA